ncbi:phenylacetate--CoA ligase family protein [Arthrobacter sp. NyZ413]|uniref:phenylacetate--CoA ligase family protein n=1 Tax=Arthrobacter sp. NyZ413 TaxID=3144669 RepID=UPI003BF87035
MSIDRRGDRVTEQRFYRPEFEQADPAAIRQYQEKKVLDLVRRVWATNEFFRTRWAEAGVDVESLNSLDDVQKAIPLIEKKDFVRDQLEAPPFGKRIEPALRQKEPLDFYTTSGTSGQGTEIHAQTRSELASMVDSYRYGLTWSGLTRGDTVALTIPITMFAGGRCEMQGAEGHGLSVLPIGNYDAHRKLTVIEQFRPKALMGSTSYFAHLASLHNDPSSLGVSTLLTGLEGASLSYIHRLEDDWNATAYDRFGCAQMRTDFMFNCEHGVGTDDRPGLLHNISPNVWLEVINPETGEHVEDGEYGEMVVTSLYNTETPLIRCRLRDGALYREGAYCPCGRPFSGVEQGSISRIDDVKKIKGVNVYPQALDDVVLALPEVDEYEVLLTSKTDATDVATITLMLKNGVPEDRREALVSSAAKSIHGKLGINFQVQVGTVARSEYKVRRWRDERVR